MSIQETYTTYNKMTYHTHLNVFESQIIKDLRCQRLEIDVKSAYRNLVYFQCLDLEVSRNQNLSRALV